MAARADMPATNLPNVECYEDLIAAGDPTFAWPELDERSACALCFTSGTTGQPKGVLYSHRGTVLSALSTGGGNGWALSADDTVSQFRDSSIATAGRCRSWRHVRREARAAGPSCRQRVAAPADRRGRRHHRCGRADDLAGDFGALPWHRPVAGRLRRIFSGGTAPPSAMIEAYLNDYGVRLSHGWGMTETTHGATISFARDDLPQDAAVAAMRTQGKPLYGNEVRIVDDEDKPVLRDGVTPGHLQCRGHWIAGAYFRASNWT